ncbi:MAG: UDP-2,3-diacylglucosamine diphosphatase LpxI [Deltaproteobacteria bacterium]|nr:UDP-2,3-diacylglucosamine diphosphatase LpxI [Deltaproteobacteria bacterium]
MERVGLIAGNGRFPLLFAQTARAAGVAVVAVAHEGETLAELAQAVDSLTWIKVGELDRVIEVFRSHQVERAVMAGGIHKATLLEHFAPDQRALRVLARATTFSDDAVLRAMAAELESEGIAVVDSLLFLQPIVTPAGVLTTQAPDERQWRDIRHGFEVAKGIGRYDIGQSVVVQSGMILAVEAIEGTDAAMRRAGELGARGAVLVKASKPGQDLRFDVPAAGPETVAVARAAGIAVLALEAGKTLMLDRAEFLAQAQAAAVAVVGVAAES